MHASRARKETELDPRGVEIRFSPQVRSAFADLAASVHSSEHFEAGVREILERWAEGKTQSVHSFAIALPLIAENTFAHIHATNDKKAREAWEEICSQIPEQGFTLSQRRTIKR